MEQVLVNREVDSVQQGSTQLRTAGCLGNYGQIHCPGEVPSTSHLFSLNEQVDFTRSSCKLADRSSGPVARKSCEQCPSYQRA